MIINILINNIGLLGISLEVIGFILILVTVKHTPRSTPSADFETGFGHVRNVVTNTHPNWYYVGIGLVIVGLICQGISQYLSSSSSSSIN